MPKFRYSLDTGTTWTVVNASLPYSIPSTAGQTVLVEPIGDAVTNAGGATVPAAPTVTLTAGDGQISIAWSDNSNGGATITAHRVYVNGTGMSPITSASPYVLTGLANGTAVSIEVSAINSVGEGPKSAAQSATPVGASSTYLPASPAPYMVHGIQRMVSGYSGPLFTLRRSSDNATLDVSAATGSDQPDWATVNAWAGTKAFYTTIYDQSGNARHATQTDPLAQPAYLPSDSYGGYYPALIDSVQALSPQVKGLTVSSISLSRIAHSSFICASLKGGASNGSIIEFANAGQATRQIAMQTLASSFGLNVRDTATKSTGVTPKSNRAVLGYTSAASGSGDIVAYENGTTYALAASSTASILTLGYGNGSSGSAGGGEYAMFGGVTYASALGSTDANAVVGALNTMFSTPASFTSRVVMDGTSLMHGYLSTELSSPLREMQLSSAVEKFVTAVVGQTVATIDTNKAARFAPLYTSAYGAGKCVFIFEGGINDIRGTTTGSALYTLTTSIITYLKGLGFTVGVMTLGAWNDGTWTSARETQRADYNTRVLANTAGADFIIDRAADAFIGGANTNADNTTYFQTDKLHLTNAGNARMATLIKSALATLGIS